MKKFLKITSLLLILTFAFTLYSCSNDNSDEEICAIEDIKQGECD